MRVTEKMTSYSLTMYIAITYKITESTTYGTMQPSIGYQMLSLCSDNSTEDVAIWTSEIDQGNRELEWMQVSHHHHVLF